MSIQSDDNTDTGLSDDNAVSQLMASLQPAKGGKPAAETEDLDEVDEDEGDDETTTSTAADEATGDEDEGDEPDDAEEGEETEETEEAAEGEEGDKPAAAAPPAIADDAVVKVLVDGQEIETTIGGLKRLAGQEASLTRKSQEADQVGGRAAAVLTGALEAVLEDLEPYKDVDWVLEGQRMDPEEFQWHRAQYTRLQGRYNNLVGRARDFEAQTTERSQKALQEQAAEAVRVLSDPTTGIKDWSPALYSDLMAFAVSQGLPADDVAQIANPNVIKLIHKAMMFDKAKTTAADKVEKVNTAPKRVRKGAGREAVTPDTDKTQAALVKKLASGRATDDDAVAVLMGRWGAKAK